MTYRTPLDYINNYHLLIATSMCSDQLIFKDEQKLSTLNQNQLNKVAEIKMKLESLKSDIQKANKKIKMKNFK